MNDAQETVRLSQRVLDVDELPVKITITVSIPAGWDEEHKRQVRKALKAHMAEYEGIVDAVYHQRRPTLLRHAPN